MQTGWVSDVDLCSCVGERVGHDCGGAGGRGDVGGYGRQSATDCDHLASDDDGGHSGYGCESGVLQDDYAE